MLWPHPTSQTAPADPDHLARGRTSENFQQRALLLRQQQQLAQAFPSTWVEPPPGSSLQSASYSWNDQKVHHGEAEKAGKEPFPHHSADDAFLIQFADQQFSQPEQDNFGDERPYCEAGFLGIEAQHLDQLHAGGEDGSRYFGTI